MRGCRSEEERARDAGRMRRGRDGAVKMAERQSVAVRRRTRGLAASAGHEAAVSRNIEDFLQACERRQNLGGWSQKKKQYFFSGAHQKDSER
ncbi:MAG: hypothetical protein BHW56_03120 [Acetobacter sp. 46_36]|nr:MAG: hypothetical protein BHW56_03120 [Acetobacter sp. 46_36]